MEDLIREFCEQEEGCTVYEDYSGRGMLGRTCIGIVVDKNISHISVLIRLTQFFDEHGFDDADLQLEGTAIDELGLDTIIYFPNSRM